MKRKAIKVTTKSTAEKGAKRIFAYWYKWGKKHRQLSISEKRAVKKEFADALLYLHKNYTEVKIYDGILYVTTDDIINPRYRPNNLGQAVIKFYFRRMFNENFHSDFFQETIIVKTADGRRFKQEHVYPNYLCTGEGAQSIRRCLNDIPPRFDDMIDMIQQILRS